MRKPKNDFPPPKYNFYRSRSNGAVYPAMSHPSGYEDKHPSEWEGVADDIGRQELRLEIMKANSLKQQRAARVGSAADMQKHFDDAAAVDATLVTLGAPLAAAEIEYPDPDPVPLGRGLAGIPVPPPPSIDVEA